MTCLMYYWFSWAFQKECHRRLLRHFVICIPEGIPFETAFFLQLLETNKKKQISVALSPQANYTDWATTTGRRILVPTFADRWLSRGQRGESLTAVNLSFLDWSRYFFLQVAPHLSSRGWVDPVPDPLLLRKFSSAGNQTRDICVCSQELWPLDHRGGPLQLIQNHKMARDTMTRLEGGNRNLILLLSHRNAVQTVMPQFHTPYEFNF
jgi:hypothetical protein